MKIRLSDGSIIETKPGTPSKHTVRISSGRSSRRSANSQRSLRSVGGVSQAFGPTNAIYHGADPKNEDGTISTNYDPLCIVVDPRKRNFTNSPQVGQRFGDRGGKGA